MVPRPLLLSGSLPRDFVCLFVCNSAQKRERSRAAVCLLLPVLEAVPPLKIYGNNAPALRGGGEA